MFYARVIVDKPEVRNPDKTITMPSLLPGSKTERYDCVQGHTGNSDVFMIYANKKTYPEYLITYK